MKTGHRYEIEVTTRLAPHGALYAIVRTKAAGLKQRKILKQRYNYVSLTKVTEIREQIRAAGAP